MWTCPKCQHQFYNTNQAHSCGHYTTEDFLAGKTKLATDLFHYFLAEYKKIGAFAVHPVKTRVALLTKMRFCSINKIGADYIGVHFVLTTAYNEAGCFYKIDNLANRFFVHHARIYAKPDIDAELKKYMRLAYDTGNRLHVKQKASEQNRKKT